MSSSQTSIHSCHDLEFQQRINRELLDLISSINIGLESAAELKHKIFLAVSYKCFATAKAIHSLCDKNLYDDAFALLRVLMEGIINATYIWHSDAQMASDYVDYPKFRAWNQFEQIRKVAPSLADLIPPSDQAQMQAEYQQVRARYENNRPPDWTKDNTFKRATFIDAHDQQMLFRVLINVAWQEASAYVHSTALSIDWRISGNTVLRDRTPTQEQIATILYYSNIALFTLLSILDKHAGKAGIGRWKELYDEWKKP